MSTSTISRVAAGGLLLAGMLALSACSLDGADPDPTEEALQDASATQFVACLTNQGQTAKFLDDGSVGILIPEGVEVNPSGGDGQGLTSMMKDDEGEWAVTTTSSALPTDGGIRDAWAACEVEVPDFEQPEQTHEGDPAEDEAQIESALAFAECARENGYPDWPDPDDYGAMGFPEGLTEDGLISVLDDCFDPEDFHGVSLNGESTEELGFDAGQVIMDYLENAGIGPGDGEGPDQGDPGTTDN